MEDDLVNDIEIITDKQGKQYGSNVEQKREPLTPSIIEVNSKNWSSYLPETVLDDKRKQGLEEGQIYARVAVDPESGGRVDGSKKRR